MSDTPDTSPAASIGGFSLYDIDVDEAQAAYDRFRQECPVARSEAFDGHWILTRYEDVRAAARAWETFSSSQGHDLPKHDLPETAITTDPPLHGEYRGLMQEVLNQKTINELEPYVVGLAHRLIDDVAAAGSVDLVTQYTEQIPPAVISRIVGLDPELALEMRDVSIRLGGSWEDPDEFERARADFRDFVLPQIESRRQTPRDDYLTRLATQPFRGAPLADATIVQMMIGFLLAGHESTTAAMSSVLFHLLSEPGRVARVLADDRLLSGAIEEALRLDTPFHHFRRVTTCPVTVAGTALPEGADVMLNYAAANRDPEEFPDPSTFDLERRPNRHLGFGFGIHTCVGAPLARMELLVAVPELLRRLPDLALAGDPSEVRWRFLGGNLAFIDELRATFTPES